MKFVISGDIKRRKNLYWAVLFFSVFSLLFWISSFIYYYLNFGFDYDSLFKYYFTDFDFPEKISLQQITENVHINLFLNGFLILMVVSIFNVFDFRENFKLWLIVLTFLFGILYSVVDVFIFLLDGFVILKAVFFLLFQMFLGFCLLLVFYGLLKGHSNVSIGNLRKIIGFFSFFMLIFFLVNFLLFYQKMGFSFESVKTYYLGNPELYVKPKTFEGLFKVFYPHLITMALLSFTLSHFLLFSVVKKSIAVTLGITTFIFGFIDNLSGILIRFLDEKLVYVKFLSFLLLELLFITGFLIVLFSSLKKEPY
ncbi:hypothetical protein [Sulfurihydrogenibium sp.]|uniref:hypothetical protein n=1 Tax=Sulfurihydrogenibium sp. TaxID=2053621 RepID=UPI002614FEB0|nr:hypothetical protein [Sulfurihydrogenibium sp.]